MIEEMQLKEHLLDFKQYCPFEIKSVKLYDGLPRQCGKTTHIETIALACSVLGMKVYVLYPNERMARFYRKETPHFDRLLQIERITYRRMVEICVGVRHPLHRVILMDEFCLASQGEVDKILVSNSNATVYGLSTRIY